MNHLPTMPQQNYRKQLETYIQDGSIPCYSDSDVTLDRVPPGRDSVEYKGQMKCFDHIVAKKILSSQQHDDFPKEVTI
jgi:hypothetical protein